MLAIRLSILACVIAFVLATMTGLFNAHKHHTIPIVQDANGNVSNIKR